MSRELPRIARPSASAEESRHREPTPTRPLGREQRQVDDDRREQLVEDLAVDVHVVPDEVRVERRHERGDQPGPRGEEAPTGLVDDERSGGGDDDLGEPDRPPLAARDPVDRDQEERVQRLRPGRRLAAR